MNFLSWLLFNLFGQPYLRLLNKLGIRNDVLVCIRQDETWCWPDHLGERTSGQCVRCGAPIYYEKQNEVFQQKICHRC